MELRESNLALLQAQTSRSASPEISQDKQIAEIERECNAFARRLERQGRIDCLTRQSLAFTQGRLHQADGAAICRRMATWQRIEQCLAAEFVPLETNFVQKRFPLRRSRAQLQQSIADENHKLLTDKLGPWLNDQAKVSMPLPPALATPTRVEDQPSQEEVEDYLRRDQADHEASLLSSIQHDYDREYGLDFAHCDGRLLSDEHERNPLSYGEFKSTLRQVVDALQHLHGLSLYHGDIRSESIIIRRRSPTIDVALLNFDTSPRRTTRESLIRWDMDHLLEWSLQTLCGVQSFSDIQPHIRNASVKQMLSAFPTARYEAIANNSTHAASLFIDPDFCSVLSDDSPENALTLPLDTASHPVPSFD
ncbi:hypothetical protein G3M48_008936 [Beauveria asiatica]|uniref:Protein kinase domain-containing protein n=1 Tax=Beauveria asiatica TaxID=1069075 RepID=A0AAW0S8S4_9HYPO